MKKILGVFSVLFLLITASCTVEDSKEAYRYEILKALDSGDYDKVIELLENQEKYQKAFSKDELNLNLAAAYIGKAGYDVNTIINDIIETDSEGDAFKIFAQAISNKASGNAIKYLNKALEKYLSILNGVSCDTPDNLTDYQKDACFLKGLIETAKGTNSLVLIIEENPDERADTIEKWVKGVQTCTEDDRNANSIPDEIDATACAIEYANNGTCSIPNTTLSTSSVTFTDGNSNFNYTLLTIQINPDSTCTGITTGTFYKLVLNTDVVLTDGYCDTNFNPCQSPDGVTCFPCPVVQDTTNLTVEDTIVDTINTGVDSVISSLPEDVKSDVEQNLQEFKREICLASPSDCLCDGVQCTSAIDVQNADELTITEEALAEYLKKQ